MTPSRFKKLKHALSRRQPDLTVLAEAVHKGQNIAAIRRTCDAVGIHRLHTVPSDGDLRRHHMISGGSRKYVTLQVHAGTGQALDLLQAQGLRIYAAHWSDRAVDFRQIDYTLPCAIVLGSELRGVSEQVEARADAHLTIPMMGLVSSLNVSVAAALILYEAMAQRERAGMYRECRLAAEEFRRTLFEWCYPDIAQRCREQGIDYPALDSGGLILENPFP